MVPTLEVTLGGTVRPVQPLEERSHHLGAAEAFEACTDVFMVPLQGADLEDPVGGDEGVNNGLDDLTIICSGEGSMT